ncbi:MAG TPA: helix-turn-helix domain-containing protein [Polyangia bacterium]|jgi:AcrR family transcriptional regulator
MSPGTRRNAQKLETRRVVLDAALALFEERGYEPTTMRALAERAGVALGTIFTHFPDKPALLVAAFETDLGKVVEGAFARLPRRDVRAQLLHVARTLYRFYARRPRLSRELVENTLFLESPQGAHPLETQVQRFLERVASVIADAVRRDELRSDLAPFDAALGFWSDYFTGLVIGLQQPRLGVAGQLALVARLLDLRLDGMRRKR